MKNSILVITELFYPEGGGAEKATYLILRYLTEHNFKISVLTSTKNPAKIPGVNYYITPLLQHTNRLTKQIYLKLLARDPIFIKLLQEHDTLYIPLYAYPLIHIAKQRGLRVVVHLHNYMPVRYNSVKYFFEPDTIGILDEFKLAIFHEYYVQQSLLRTLLMPLSFSVYLLNRRQIAEADKLICVSFRQAEIVIKSNPHLINKVEVVYNPIPPELLSYEPKKELDDIPTFLYVGGDSYIKGFHILLQTLNKLGKQGVKARFILTNRYSPRSLELLKQLSDKYRNLEIQVLGRIEYSKLIELHRKTWALLFPSIWEEPLPYAIIETSLLGTIPIASKVGGVLELLAGSPASDFLFSPGNVEELADKVLLLINNKNTDVIDVIRELGYDIRDHIAKVFNLRTIESQILRVFTEE